MDTAKMVQKLVQKIANVGTSIISTTAAIISTIRVLGSFDILVKS